MMKRTLGGVALALAIYGTAQAACTPPASTATRTGRMQGFTYAMTQAQYLNPAPRSDGLSSATRDYIWANAGDVLGNGDYRLPSGVLSSAYTAVYRYPANDHSWGSATVTGRDLAWFNANHPSWILLQGDKKTPAYAFGDHSYIPLDLSNSAVRSFRIMNEIDVMMTQSNGISSDNVGSTNDVGAVGVCSVAINMGVGDCAANGGTFTAIYDGSLAGHCANGSGSCWTDNQVTWLNQLRTEVNSLGGCTSGNVGYVPSDTANTTRLIDAGDIWFDEEGWTGDAHPPVCSIVGSPSSFYGAAWVSKLAYVAQRTALTGIVASLNSICPVTAQNRQVVQWAVASSLLVAGDHTYIGWFFSATFCQNSDMPPVTLDDACYYDNVTGGAWPEFYWTQGASVLPLPGTSPPYNLASGTYYRIFANGAVFVNPSETNTTFYDTGTAIRHGFDGLRYTGVLTLPPLTALVLIDGEPSGSRPAH